MAKAVNDENFESEVLNCKVPVLVDFWADWCGPCKILSPIIDELSTLTDDKAKVVKLNVDESPQTSAKYEITAIPTTILFENGKETVVKTGVFPKSEYLNMLGL
ncbi:MAG: thioredoxin [Chitinivibrionia bacterium]|nr:thioredoxin [Chitinivibrionia bacterium]MCL1947416.1 thioredoxin [Chitinivibrionia bacterium]